MSSSTRSRLARPLVVLALLGSLVACGDNTDFSRGPTNCDSSGEDASNPNDASCQETGENPGNDAPTTDDANPGG
ncbi:hypothetical protein [Geodermatophilus sp. URMC 62]|jgi:hypothetical protein|uniref:hypothetical protein n=1 Tax=Geodermatophilus sp. URMC 62 TaxID=3423414 RepID=UPI00406C3274